MTNNKKRALFSSVVALILCFAMLIGTTFAWFTDSVTSGNNVINAGNLDVELYHGKTTDPTVPVGADTILFTDTAGNEIKKWEPGVVAYTNLKVANVGSLALKYNMSVSATDANATEDGYKLTDILQLAVVPGGVTGTTREAVLKEAKNATPASLTSFAREGKLYPADSAMGDSKSETYGLIVYWSDENSNEIDNRYNMNNGKKPAEGDVLQVTLGINLYATQLAYESDSFGIDYDAEAALCQYIVTNEAELVAALAEVKNGDTIGIKGNVEWTTGAGIGSTPFAENVSFTLAAVSSDATLTAKGSGVGAIGVENGTVTFRNLKIVDESVSYAENSWEYGYLEFRGNTVFQNCDIVNAIMMEGESAKFINCDFNSHDDNQYAVWVSDGDVSFEGCYITGARGIKVHEDYGSEVGTVIINNNNFGPLTKKPGLAIGTVNADTTIQLTNNLFAGTQVGDSGNNMYETDTEVKDFTFICENNNNEAAHAADNATLKDAIKNNATVKLSDGEYSLPTLSGKEGVTIIGEPDGSTVIGGKSASTGFGGNFGKNTTIQNVTFSGSTNGVRSSYAQGGTSTFDNCTFAGDSIYGFHIDESNGATFIFNNCTFSGFNAFAGDLEKVIFNNCTFLYNGNYGHTNIWSTAEFNNCTFGDKASVGTRGDNAHIYFDGIEESFYHEYIGSAASLIDFADSVNNGGDSWNGQKVLLVSDIDLNNAAWTPIGQTGATQFNGTFDGQNHIIKNLNVDSSAQTGGHYSSGLFGWAESNVTIKNVKIDGAKIVGNHNVAGIVGYTYSGKISNCHVYNAEIVCNHANGDACGDKCGLIAGYAGDESRFTNCSASNSTVKAGRDAGQLIGAGYNVSVSGCSASNVTVTATGECTGANVNAALIGRVLG